MFVFENLLEQSSCFLLFSPLLSARIVKMLTLRESMAAVVHSVHTINFLYDIDVPAAAIFGLTMRCNRISTEVRFLSASPAIIIIIII